jgi:hypothetical protein
MLSPRADLDGDSHDHERGLPVVRAVSKQEIRRNPLAEWVGGAVRFVQAHQAAVAAGVVMLAIGASVAAGYWRHQQQQEEEASRLLGNALAAASG